MLTRELLRDDKTVNFAVIDSVKQPHAVFKKFTSRTASDINGTTRQGPIVLTFVLPG
jgi:hypothetical protein